MNERVKKWLELAKWAPSGGNLQPWIVDYDDTDSCIYLSLRVNAFYKKEAPLMDMGLYASAISLGALALNIEIAANNDGFTLTKEIVKEDFVFLKFIQQEPLYVSYTNEDVINRRTDRFRYKNQRLPETFKTRYEEIKKRYPRHRVMDIFENKKKLGKIFSELERIRWKNFSLIKSTLEELNFDKVKQTGIPSEQLGVGDRKSVV